MKRSSLLLGVCATATVFATGCSSTVASLDGPTHRQKLGTPQPVAVNLGHRADPQTFRADVNGTDITGHFVFNDNTGQLDGLVFEPAAPNQPHHITVTAEPAVNEKGRPMGEPFSETLTFFPPKLSLQGNVGIGDTSRVDVNRDGRTSVMVRLPMAPLQPTVVTITPTASDHIALNDRNPGEPIQLLMPAGRRVAVFTVRGQRPGQAGLRVEAPGYVASAIDVNIDGPTITAAVNNRF